MDTIRKLVILVVVIVLVVVLGPVVLRVVYPSRAFNRDLENGAMRWRPVYGVLVERELGANLWEQYIVDWVGPGTIQVVQYVNAGESDLLPDDGGSGRQRVGTEELRATLNLSRMYSIARSPDEFPVVIRQKYEAEVEKGPFASGGKFIEAPYGDVYFGEYAAVQLEKAYRWGFKTLAAGDVVYLSRGRWSPVDQGDLKFIETLPAGGYAGFTVLKGVRLTRGMPPADRIETLREILWQMGGDLSQEFPRGSDGTTLAYLRAPDDASLARGIQRLQFSNDWVFPLDEALDLRRQVAESTRDSGGIANPIAIGFGYALPTELMPATDSMWFLRCLEQTEIAVPYSSPL